MEDVGRRALKMLSNIPLDATIDIQDHFQTLTFEIMCFFSLGVNAEDIEKSREPFSFLQAQKRFLTFPSFLFCRQYLSGPNLV